MACSALFVSVLVFGAAGAPVPSLRGSGSVAQGKCCFNGCDDENSCVTDYCVSQELCLKPQPDGGCDASPPYGRGAKPSWCPTPARKQLYSVSPGDNATANATVNALQAQSCHDVGLLACYGRPRWYDGTPGRRSTSAGAELQFGYCG